MNLQLITPEQALLNWPTISAQFSRARETGQGESSMVDYMTKILNMTAQCWVVLDEGNIVGAGLTEILHYTQHKTLHIILFAGEDFEAQSKDFDKVVQFAKVNDCVAIEQWGRKGWARTLPKYIPQFKEVYTVMRYDLKEQNEIQ
jgi:hypothetical protein